MAKSKNESIDQVSQTESPVGGPQNTVELSPSEKEIIVEGVIERSEKSLEPAAVELQSPEKDEIKPARSSTEISAQIYEKLSRKTDKGGLDPFIPSSQLESEVKEVASQKGFPLSRGTEVGARLMARSKRAI